MVNQTLLRILSLKWITDSEVLKYKDKTKHVILLEPKRFKYLILQERICMDPFSWTEDQLPDIKILWNEVSVHSIDFAPTDTDC